MRATSAILLLCASLPVFGRAGTIDFARDIQPLFAEYCLQCHGPDDAKGGLVLTTRQAALKELKSGDRAVVPGKVEESALISRIISTDPDEVMPPPKKDKRPKPAEIELMKQWIASGAEWSVHWAYRPIVRTEVPSFEFRVSGESNPKPDTQNSKPARNPIDAFVLAKLAENKIAPSPEADRFTLIKRVYYDLLGLPPTPAEVDTFVNDQSPDAYAKLVERALASPHYGERWGRHWLDRARYADSDGYEKDSPRPEAWRYRDWVIDAVNRDMPFDEFTIEQLAGDLLPNPTPEQVLATAFHRQTLTNREGGVDQEQFRNEAVFDRTETTGSVWLAHTVTCARCHNHKYDQIAQAEYYRLFAFFNNADETMAKVGTSDAALHEFETKNAAHAAKLRSYRAKLVKAQAPIFDRLLDWEKETSARLKAAAKNKAQPQPLTIESAKSELGATLTKLDDGSVLASGEAPKKPKEKETYIVEADLPAGLVSALRLEALPDDSLPGKGPGRSGTGNFVLSELTMRSGSADVEFHSPKADYSQKDFAPAGVIDGKPDTGWAISSGAGKTHQLTLQLVRPIDGAKTPRVTITMTQQYGKEHTIGRFRLAAIIGDTDESIVPAELKRLIATGSEKWTNEQRQEIVDWLTKFDPAASSAAEDLAKVEASGPKPPMMDVRVLTQRRNPRETHIFHRGEFLSPAEAVQPGTLAILPPLKQRETSGQPDRLDLARWIVSRDNPLTARVAVNQIWMHLFGEGIVRTPGDFGVRGDKPTHPELLDWLAAEFRDTGWSRKHMVRLIVNSATYRQRSDTRAELNDTDPRNLLLARQNRLRVEGEVVRDLHLAASGLLSHKVGGPSVYPPMPPEIAELSYANNFKWAVSKGEDRYRRGMYTFFKRTAPYPDLMTFDCPDANVACIRRAVSDTPLQALTTLNSDTFNEAARALSKQVIKATVDDNARLTQAFRDCLVRPPRSDESAALLSLLNDARAYYAAHADDAKKAGGDGKTVGENAETAAWTSVTRIILNTDEIITRE
jgi:hypothetical protein